MIEIEHRAWLEEGVRRYGGDRMQWRFRCPVCKIATTAHEWVDAGAKDMAAFSCIGRTKANRADAFNRRKKEQPCNYAGGGLFRLNPIHVQLQDGGTMQMFDFADEPLDKGPTNASDLV